MTQVQGRLTLATVTQFGEAFARAHNSGARVVIVDFAECPFVDAFGIGALITAIHLARAAGQQVHVAGLQTQLRAVLELTKLADAVPCYPDLKAALATSARSRRDGTGEAADRDSVAPRQARGPRNTSASQGPSPTRVEN